MEPDQSLSWFDVAVGGAVLVSALLAFTRGLLHEVLGIVPWLGGAAATVYGFPLVRPYARELIGIDLAADAAAGVVLFFAAFIVLSMFSRALFSQVPHSALNVFDRSLGFLFGLARGAFLLVLAYLGLGMFLPTAEHPEWIRDARTRPAIEQGVAWIRTIVPTALVSEGAQPAGEAEEARETGRMMERLLSPAPEGPTSRSEPGYDQKAREQLDRLIETTR